MHLLRKCLLLGLCFCLLFGFWVNPSLASIRHQEEAPGQVLYQSRQSIRDNHGQTWQVILFKRVKDQVVTTVDLRLVGYPERAVFLHPGSLTLSDVPQGTLTASDQFDEESPAPNVGQFDLKTILPQLPTDRPVLLTLPLREPTTLEIPIAVLLEWQLMI
ncbi:DUF3122 domain-containing protein [Synechococcus moorigangaii CMS01]|nr:DUF3122 domain-containing protein [Synechococcus moorigangaii CMS01]